VTSAKTETSCDLAGAVKSITLVDGGFCGYVALVCEYFRQLAAQFTESDLPFQKLTLPAEPYVSRGGSVCGEFVISGVPILMPRHELILSTTMCCRCNVSSTNTFTSSHLIRYVPGK
jgi:hypothetical protein